MMEEFASRSIVVMALVAIVASLLVVGCNSRAARRHQLSVRVVHMFDESPATDGTVEVVSVKNGGNESSGGRVVARRSVDAEGEASFHLRTGHYILRMRSGYGGQMDISLQDDTEVTLKVIPVRQ